MRWFPSKVDALIAGMLALGVVVPAGLGVSALLGGGDGAPAYAGPFALIVAAAIAGLYGILVVPMRYGVSADELVVCSGVVRSEYSLARIRSVEPSGNPLNAPALSLDRLAIELDDGDTILISPTDREAFLALLAERAGLERQGERLVRRG